MYCKFVRFDAFSVLLFFIYYFLDERIANLNFFPIDGIEISFLSELQRAKWYRQFTNCAKPEEREETFCGSYYFLDSFVHVLSY